MVINNNVIAIGYGMQYAYIIMLGLFVKRNILTIIFSQNQYSCILKIILEYINIKWF